MDTIDPLLPWGCWLRVEVEPNRRETLVDEDGRRWRSVREAFWVGRCGMPLVAGEPPAEILETIHAVLAAKSRRDPSVPEMRHDVIGHQALDLLLMSWMIGQGLLAPEAGEHPWNGQITAEGHAVLLMLDATRPVPVRRMRPSRPSIDLLVALGRGSMPGEERRTEVEAAAAGWEAGFLRRDLGSRPTIVLFRRGDGAMPVLQTVWSMTFDDVQQRDGFYDWLCHRLDRWPAWAEIAGRHSGPELTNHLLRLLAAQITEDGSGGLGDQRYRQLSAATPRS